VVAIVLTPAATVALRKPSPPSKPITLAGNSVAVIDPQTSTIVGEIPVGGIPGGIAVGAGAVWVGNQVDNTLLRIDPESRRVQKTIELGAQPLDVTVDAGAIWILSAAQHSIIRVDPIRNQVVGRIRLDGAIGDGAHLAPAGRFLYVAHDGVLTRVDPATDTATTMRDADVLWIGADDNLLWVVSNGRNGGGDAVEGIAPAQFRVLAHFRIPDVPDIDGIAAEAGSLWTAGPWDLDLSKVNPRTGRLTGRVSVGHGIGGVVFGEGALWVIGKMETVLRVDPRSGRVLDRVTLGVPVAGMAGSESGPLAVGDGAVWIATRQW
jgi:YVTN family beta-propeller protein